MLTSVRQFFDTSLRRRLLALVLLPLLIILPAILGATIYWSQKFTYELLYAKVNTDLKVAKDIFSRLQQQYLAQLKGFGESYAFQGAIQDADQNRLTDQLHVFLHTTNFDFLRLVKPGDTWRLPESPLLANALRLGEAGVGVQVMDPEELRFLDPTLPDQVRLPLLPTPHSTPSKRKTENRGMAIRTIYPIRDANNRVLAVLDGGVLLNRNFTVVDTVRDLVYGPGSLPEGAWGAVTILLDDVRISTNVPLGQGQRALGTRVSADVRSQVLQDGATWVDRAFVVNDWYISAYEPITDVAGERVGMLYAGYLEAPFRTAYLRTIALLILAIGVATLLAAWMAIRGAVTIFRPIEKITHVARATQRGEEQRIGALAARDEIGELARQFDSMLDLLKSRNDQIRISAEQLETKVETRTRELREQNVRLQDTIHLLNETRQQLLIAEKLAAVGELVAGVAHEINNPIAVILGNMEVLEQELGEGVLGVQTEVDLIIKQVFRVRAIVDKLRQYAQPADFGRNVEWTDVNEVVRGTLPLVDYELARKSARLRQELGATLHIQNNQPELQQVLVNLLVNAAQAIDQGGLIRIITTDRGDSEVDIVVEDDGPGIPKENLNRVFDPFFTTKPSGTGLGLSVTYGVVHRYGGSVRVESGAESGARIIVTLPVNPVFDSEEDPATATA